MTIVTKPLTDEKKDLKPLVVDGGNGVSVAKLELQSFAG